jgi:integrase
MLAAGLVSLVPHEQGNPRRDGEGKLIVQVNYTAQHTLQHFFTSRCINRREDGGLGLPAKLAQQRLGHSPNVITLDTYGHLSRAVTIRRSWRLPSGRF